jgi:hypothetical protein
VCFFPHLVSLTCLDRQTNASNQCVWCEHQHDNKHLKTTPQNISSNNPIYSASNVISQISTIWLHVLVTSHSPHKLCEHTTKKTSLVSISATIHSWMIRISPRMLT